jgi:hypothetical protein
MTPRFWLLILAFPIGAQAYKSRHNMDHLHYSRADPRHYLEFNRNRHPSDMKPVPGSRPHGNQSYRRYSRYDGRFWEGYYANGGGAPCAAILAQPPVSPFWLNTELKGVQEKMASPETSPEEVVANALTQSPEWTILSRELRELALYFYGRADLSRFTSPENQTASRKQLMSAYLYVLGTAVSSMMEVVAAFEKIQPAQRNPAHLRQLEEAVQRIRGSRVSIENISNEANTRQEVDVGRQALGVFNDLEQRLNRLSFSP